MHRGHQPKPFGCCCGRTNAWAAFLSFLGIVLLLIAILIPHFVNQAIDQGLRDQVIIKSTDSPGYLGWADTRSSDSSPFEFRVYVFHLVNPLEVLQNGARPYFQERGPYFYTEQNVMFNVTFINNTYIKHKTWTYYNFDASRSCAGCKDTDKFTSLNIPVQGIFANADDQNKAGFWGFFAQFQTYQDFFVERSVNDVVFGYDDPSLAWVKKNGGPSQANLSTVFPGLQQNQTDLSAADAAFGYDIVYSGESDESLSRAYVEWHGSPYVQVCAGQCPPDQPVNAWGTPEDSKVPTAGLGKQYRRGLKEGDTVQVFVTQAFRAVTLRNVDGASVTVKDIPMLSFTLDYPEFLNATENPANAKWFQFGPRGLWNISKAEHGIKAFLSKPRFLDADPSVGAMFDGDMTPNRDLHDSVINVEPNLGTTMDAHKSIQISFEIGPIPAGPGKTPYYAKVPHCYFPVAWFQESGTIPDASAKKFRDSVLAGQYVVKLSKYLGGILCGLSFAALAFLLLDKKNWTKGGADDFPAAASIQSEDAKTSLLSANDRKAGDL